MISVIHAEILLAKYFMGRTEDADAADAIQWARAQLPGLTRKQIRQARKNLKVRSYTDGQGYKWAWESPTSPEKVWEEKSREVLGTTEDEDAGTGH